ncbi:acyl carrier protein [Patescibacteria group bacterium]|nr:acyl carrier protein [Patescibacteria group bacterium]MBU4015950.1 acyl carrier protein [Patescibacteria group bacterium]MBU4099650.1 acyl carrier protein [Patescibacteria group bacterium]
MADKITIDILIQKYIMGGEEAAKAAMTENKVSSMEALTLSDLKMDSLDVVQLAVKVQDDLGIKLSDDEFAKVPQGKGDKGEVIYKPADKVTLGDIAQIINSKV